MTKDFQYPEEVRQAWRNEMLEKYKKTLPVVFPNISNPVCRKCVKNPVNGGNGECRCTLGVVIVTY